jgi:hypothetical protein
MSTDTEYSTVIYNNGRIRQMVVTADITKNTDAVNDYIRQYQRFLAEGGTIKTTGSVMTPDGSLRLGIKQDRTQARFVFTWTEK